MYLVATLHKVRAQNGISGSYMDAIFKLVTYKESGKWVV